MAIQPYVDGGKANGYQKNLRAQKFCNKIAGNGEVVIQCRRNENAKGFISVGKRKLCSLSAYLHAECLLKWVLRLFPSLFTLLYLLLRMSAKAHRTPDENSKTFPERLKLTSSIRK